MNGTSLARLALYIVGFIGTLDVIGLVVLTMFDKPIDDVLKQVLSNAILGVVALLKTTGEDHPVITAETADVEVTATKRKR